MKNCSNSFLHVILFHIKILFTIQNSNEFGLCFLTGKTRLEMIEHMVTFYSIDINHESQTAHRTVHQASTSIVSLLLNKHIKVDQQMSTLGEELSRFHNLTHSDDNILSFWKKNEINFPKLAKIAKVVLSIPMSSAKSESAFSIAGGLIRKRRASLTPFRAEKLLFIHDNYDIINL